MTRSKYATIFMPLDNVKEKQFVSRALGCKGVGLSYLRCRPGEGATYVHRHRVQEEVFVVLKGTGTIILDGKRISMPEGTIVRVSPTVYRAIGNDSDKDVIVMALGAVPPKKFPFGGRTLLGDGIPNRNKVPRWKKSRVERGARKAQPDKARTSITLTKFPRENCGDQRAADLIRI